MVSGEWKLPLTTHFSHYLPLTQNMVQFPMKILKLLLIFFVILFFNACALKEHTYNVKPYDIYSLKTDLTRCHNQKLYIYIEGDGLAWKTKYEISNDPTPTNSVSLKLLKAAKQPCAIYLARPCQYTKQTCDKKEYTSHRYSYTIIQSYDTLLNELKTEFGFSSFVLVGHSGGGVIAALLASQREDIDFFITIASNLDTLFWTNYHNISSLIGSLNPANFAYLLENIPQYHLIGKNDTNVPLEVFQSYESKFKNTQNIHYRLYSTNHTDNWEKFYTDFLKTVRRK
jgi:hypothetical protein